MRIRTGAGAWACRCLRFAGTSGPQQGLRPAGAFQGPALPFLSVFGGVVLLGLADLQLKPGLRLGQSVTRRPGPLQLSCLRWLEACPGSDEASKISTRQLSRVCM